MRNQSNTPPTTPTESGGPQHIAAGTGDLLKGLEDPRQLRLPLEFAPDPVREHGLRDAHSRPLVAWGKGQASFRVGPRQAWEHPLLELRAANSWPAIILDLDGDEAVYRFEELVRSGRLPRPNWSVRRMWSGNVQGIYNFAPPVHRAGLHVRRKPILLYARVEAYFTALTLADAGYTGCLTRNPIEAAHLDPRALDGPCRTKWGQRGSYDLGQINRAFVPRGYRRPPRARLASGASRNCDVFRWAMQWSGKPANWERSRELAECLAECERLNEVLREQGRVPMELGEARGIGRSVNRNAIRNHNTVETYSLWQAVQGRKAGIASGLARRKKTAERDARIVNLAGKGWSQSRIASEVGLSRLGVRKVLLRTV